MNKREMLRWQCESLAQSIARFETELMIQYASYIPPPPKRCLPKIDDIIVMEKDIEYPDLIDEDDE